MNVLREWCYAVALPLAVIGCKTSPVASPVRTSNVLVAPVLVSPPAANSAQRRIPREVLPVSAIEGQETLQILPQPKAGEQGVQSREVLGGILSREWLEEEVEARSP